MDNQYNQQDLKIWETIFVKPPVDWKTLPKIPQVDDCVSFFREHRVKTIIDFGCGPGVWAVNLARQGFVVSGFDFSGSAIAYADLWAKEVGLKLKFKIAPITKNPFSEETYDAALATLILDNVSKEECSAAIDQLASSLKSGGLVYTLFNPYTTDKMLEATKNSSNPTKDVTSISYTDEELKFIFSDRFELLGFKKHQDTTRSVTLQKKNPK